MHASLFTGEYQLLLIKEQALLPLIVLFALLPGAGIAVLAARRVRFDRVEFVLCSFAASVAIAATAGTLAHWLRPSLRAVTFVYVLAGVASLGYGAWLVVKREWPATMPAGGGLAVAGAAAALAAWQRPWWGATSDTYYHLAAVRSLLATGRPMVTDPFLGTTTRLLDPTSGALHTLLAAASKAMSVDPALLWYGWTVFGAFVVVAAFWSLARTLSRSAEAATAATALCAVGAWYLDFRTFAFPNKVSLALALLAVSLLVRLLETRSFPLLAMFVVAGGAASSAHLAAAELTLLAGGMIVLVVGVAALVTRRPHLTAAMRRASLALGVTVLAAVPATAVRVRSLGGSPVIGADTARELGDIVSLPLGLKVVTPGGFGSGGPWLFWATLAIAVVMAMRAWRRHEPALLGGAALVAMPAFLLFNPAVTTPALAFSSYMTARIGELLRFVPYLAVGWALAATKPARRTQPLFWLAAAASLAAVVLAVPYVAFTFAGTGSDRHGSEFPVAVTREWDYRAYWGPRELAEVRRIVGDSYPLVVGHRETTFYLMGLVPVSVLGTLESHTPANVDGRVVEERRRENDWFMSPDSDARYRDDYLNRRRMDYVVVGDSVSERAAMSEMLREQPDVYEAVFSSPRLSLLRIDRPSR